MDSNMRSNLPLAEEVTGKRQLKDLYWWNSSQVELLGNWVVDRK